MKIIIYGLGVKGQELIRDIHEVLKNIEIVAVTDTSFVKIEKELKLDAPCIEPCCIKDYIFDYIVITPIKYFDEIRSQLCVWGIAENKIKTIAEIMEMINDAYCILCNNHVGVWHYIGMDYNIFHYRKIIGASKRRGGCPICGSSDRERYVYYIIKTYTDLFRREHSVLHFAPERMLSEKIREHCKDKYISADISRGKADVMADITNLKFENEQFEYIICNHVMEHVKEEGKAFWEMKRCLAPKGFLILTVPLCWDQKTYENNKINTGEKRIEYYGQEDHVRLYGKDIVERVETFGFDVTIYISNEVVNNEIIKRFGFINKDAVLLCQKREY